MRSPVGLAVLGVDPLSLVLGNPQVTVDTFVVHREHRRRGAGAVLLAAAAAYAPRPAPRTSSPRWPGTRPSGSGSSPGWASRR